MGLALLKNSGSDEDPYAFLSAPERELVLPIIGFLEEELPRRHPEAAAWTTLEQALELYRRAADRAVDDLAFSAACYHWHAACGASDELILCACAIILARQASYRGPRNVRRAVTRVLQDFAHRPPPMVGEPLPDELPPDEPPETP